MEALLVLEDGTTFSGRSFGALGEIAGEVVAVGDGVTGFAVGDRVLARLRRTGGNVYEGRVMRRLTWGRRTESLESPGGSTE